MDGRLLLVIYNSWIIIEKEDGKDEVGMKLIIRDGLMLFLLALSGQKKICWEGWRQNFGWFDKKDIVL